MAGKPKWNVATPREYGEGKAFWVNIGSAWENDGKGKHDVTITLDALPLPDKDGKVRIFLFPKDDVTQGDRDEAQGRRAGTAAKKGRSSRDDDEEIPF
jgi:hypothetical protein